MWTRFMDMHSGGGRKLQWAYILIEAPLNEATVVFYNRFGRNPSRVTCTCCGDDYSIGESESLEQATGYDRNLRCLETPRDKRGLYKQPDDAWFKAHYYIEEKDVPEAKRRGWTVKERESWDTRRPISMRDYLKDKNVLVIRAKDIKASERIGEVPTEGYVWQD